MRGVAVLDLFCGCGGFSHGFKQAGFHIAGGVDIDKDCHFSYTRNNSQQFQRGDVRDITPYYLRWMYPPVDTRHKILLASPPCQNFSPANTKTRYRGKSFELIDRVLKIVSEVYPSVFVMENVTSVMNYQRGEPFRNFWKNLQLKGYRIDFRVVDAADYGVPQHRKRLILIASRVGMIRVPSGTQDYNTVRDAIGEVDEFNSLHRWVKMSDINLERISHSVPGGTWLDWPEHLITPWHKKPTGKTFKNPYGRMEWDKPAPTLSTQFIGYGNGRYGHPEQNRGLSLLEGMLLQGFPKDYLFEFNTERQNTRKLALLIGNAVPPPLSKAVAESIRERLVLVDIE